MAIAARLSRMVALPRDAVGQAHWVLGLAGPLLAMPLAALMVGWIAVEAVAACPVPRPAACEALSILAERSQVLVAGGVVVGLVFGLVRARGGLVGRLAGLGTAGVATAGIAAVVGLAASAGPWLVVVGLARGLLVAGVVHGAMWAADTLVAPLAAERRQWWKASLRAARLTRRTLGLGAYRQLCRDGFVRVQSALYPGRTYLVPRRTSPSGARVLVDEQGQVIGGLCLRPREPLPDPEEVVAHVLLLRGDERGYLAAANFFPYDTVLMPQATVRRL